MFNVFYHNDFACQNTFMLIDKCLENVLVCVAYEIYLKKHFLLPW